jgi:aryl-alcohol dehydrogenase-like predicted oxidoreductase
MRLGLGMAALGRPGYINLGRGSVFGGSDSRSLDIMQNQANIVLDSLYQNNNEIPWIDCARSYGLSEKFVGEYLKEKHIQPDDVIISSKWGYSEYEYANSSFEIITSRQSCTILYFILGIMPHNKIMAYPSKFSTRFR